MGNRKKIIIKRTKEYFALRENFHIAQSKCHENGIFISPDCMINLNKWRIVIEFKDKEGRVNNFKNSDPKFYYNINDLDMKIMQLYFFYADKV